MAEYANVEQVAESLKDGKKNSIPAVVLIGAGMSSSARIPDANGFIGEIKKKFPQRVKDCEQSYTAHMKKLTEDERRSLIREYIKKAKMFNLEHLCLAALAKEGYINHILTTNFDSLGLHALHSCNIYPAIHDLASASEQALDSIKDCCRDNECSLFYLHGQGAGPIMLNSAEETNRLSMNLKNSGILEELNRRCWIIIGYSGRCDPVFDRMVELKTYRRGLYWVGYKNEEPSEHVAERLLRNNYAKFVKSEDARTFLTELMIALNVPLPQIILEPFSYLEEILDIIEESPLTWSETPKFIEGKWLVRLSNELFGKSPNSDQSDDIANVFREAADEFRKQAKINYDNYAKELLIEALYLYSRAVKLDPNDWKAYAGWGETFIDLAVINADEYQKLLQIACERFEYANAILQSAEILSSWGYALWLWMEAEHGERKEQLLKESEDKFLQALELINKAPAEEYSTESKARIFSGLGKIGFIKFKQHQSTITKSERQNELECIKKYYLEGEELIPGMNSYELTKICLLQDKPDEAFKWVDIAIQTGNANKEMVLEDEDFQDYKSWVDTYKLHYGLGGESYT
jgi:hypothetical protein